MGSGPCHHGKSRPPGDISRLLRGHILKKSCFQPVTVPAGIADKNITLVVREHGAELRILNSFVPLPVTVLDHLEQAAETKIYLYESSPYALVAPFRGSYEVNRDELLKVKGAWEYSHAPE